MVENFEAIIGANIREFQRDLREVDAIIRETALGADALIGANISQFVNRAASVQATAANIANSNPTVDVDANTSGFMSQAAAVQAAASVVANLEPTVNVDADTSGFMSQAAVVQAAASAVASLEPTVTFEANTAVASAQATGFIARLRAMTAQNFVVRMQTSWNNYQQVMGQMATFSRNFGEFAGMVGRGGMMLVSPAAIPVLASAVGLVGNLGPMLGTVAGSTFALGSAFGTAGIGAAAFGAIAVTNLKDIFGASAELKKLEEKLAKADTWKEKLAIQQEIKAVQSSLNGEQTKGLDAMNKLKDTWSGIAGALQAKTIQTFTTALGIMNGVLVDLKPMFLDVATVGKRLMDTLGRAVNAAPMQNFFNYLNTTAGPMLATMTKAVGNFFQGFFSMMVAFGPLATSTAGGFLEMSEGFAKWAAGLGENKSFQTFVNYVNENMPKIRSIFGDAIQGIVNTFAAFGDSSSTMMSKLQEMMGSFVKWSTTLGESQGFKNFIDYIQTNGPVVVSTIGNIVDTIIEMGIALAPAGEAILGMVDKFFAFTSKMLEAHPWIGRIGTAALLMSGALLMALPTIAALNALLGGLITTMILFVARHTWAAITTVANWVKMAAGATLNAAKLVAAWVLVKGQAMASAVAGMIASAATFVARWTLMGAQALIHAAKVAAAWVLTTGAAMATALASMVATAAKFVARWVFMGAQALVQAARMAAAWVIAMGPIGWVTAAVIAIAALVIANWDKISAWTKKAWSTVSKWVVDKWQEMKQKTTSAASEMWKTVQDKFNSIVKSVTEKMQSAKTAIQNKWEEAKSAAISKISAILTTVTSKFAQIVTSVQSKMQNAKTTIQNKWEEAKSAATSKIAAMVSAVASKFAEIVNKVQAKMSEAKTTLSNKWEEAKSATSSKLSALVSAVTTFFSNVVSKVREKMAEAVTVLGSKVAEMPGKVLSFVGDMLSAGGDLVRGLIDGIKGMATSAIDAITGVVDGVVGKAKSLLKIKSPSRVFMEIGGFVGQGLANGISSTQKANEKVMTELGKVITNVARTNAQAIARINATAARERAAAMKERAAKEKEIERKMEEDIYQIKANAKAKKRKLTTSEILRIEQLRNDAATKIVKNEEKHEKELANIKVKASTEIKKREAEVQTERMAAIQKFVDNKAKLEGLSAIQEANVWRKAADSFKAGTQERIDAQSKYRDKLAEINKEVESINSQYSQRMIDINGNLATEIQRINDEMASSSTAAKEKLIAEEKRLNDAYDSALNERYNTLKSFAGLFDSFDMAPKESGQELLNNLQSQVDGFKSWESEISKLSKKGINEGLLGELRDMGPKALPQLLALNSMTTEQLTQYSSLFQEKSALARAEAEEQLIGMKADTQLQIEEMRKVTNQELTKLKSDSQARIIELRAMAAKELAVLKVDWAKDIRALTQSTKEEFKPLSQIGKDAVAGLIAGMKSMKGPLEAEAKAIANSVQSTIKDVMKIHSPSRVMKSLGEFAGQGLISGLSSTVGEVAAMSQKMAEAMIPNIADVQTAGVDIRSDIDNMKQQIRQELEVSMNVNHSGSVDGRSAGGFSQTVILQSPRELSPSENARELRKVGQQQAMQWGLT